MPYLSYQDLQYWRERRLHDRLRPTFEGILNENETVKARVNLLEQAFYQNLGSAVRMDTHPAVSNLLDEVQESLSTGFEVQLFLANSPVPSACVMPRYGRQPSYAHRAEQAIIIVSGHFFNDLETPEQKAILGHEIGHILYGHVDVPRELERLPKVRS